MLPFLRTGALASLLTLAALLSAANAQTFPYSAYVVRGGAEVRSGPGETFAAVERLDRGSEIEIHRRDPGGWLAIRPPDGSFNWVEGEGLELDRDAHFATAKKSGLAALLGSRLQGFRENAEWQVKLEKGESVEILGRKQVGERVWYKIAPPAGDFRWIHERLVTREPPPAPSLDESREAEQVHPEESKSNANPSPIELHAISDGAPSNSAKQASGHEPPAGFLVARGPTRNTVQLLSGEAPAAAGTIPTTPLPNAANSATPNPAPANAAPSLTVPSDGFVPRRKDGEPRIASLPPAPTGALPPLSTVGSAVLGGAAGGTVPTPVVRPNIVGDDQAAYETGLVDLELAFMLSQDPLTWNLAPLRARVEACSDVATGPGLRIRCREMLQKLTEFEGIRQRHVQLNAIAQRVPALGIPALPASTGTSLPASSAASGRVGAAPATGEKAAPATGEKTRSTDVAAASGGSKTTTSGDNIPPAGSGENAKPLFDGEGWLMPVITRRTDVPPFAITDDDGRLVGFVTPSPGLNLERYKKQKIGIKGTRGYIDEFNKPHVTAERVKVLETPKLR